jgi:hypothetical protein
MSLQRSWNKAIINNWKSQLRQRDSHKRVSGESGAVHSLSIAAVYANEWKELAELSRLARWRSWVGACRTTAIAQNDRFHRADIGEPALILDQDRIGFVACIAEAACSGLP